MLNDEDFFPHFNEVIQSYFIKNYNKIMNKLDKLKSFDGTIAKTFIWNKKCRIKLFGINSKIYNFV